MQNPVIDYNNIYSMGYIEERLIKEGFGHNSLLFYLDRWSDLGFLNKISKDEFRVTFKGMWYYQVHKREVMGYA